MYITYMYVKTMLQQLVGAVLYYTFYILLNCN